MRVSHMGKRRRALTKCVSLLPPHHATSSYLLLPPVDRTMKHGVEAAEGIMKYGVVVKEARSNLQSLQATVGLKARDYKS
jgi:hypothetical protein